MAGRVIRYKADKHHPLLYDENDLHYNPDPDFTSNSMPVWAICGPEIRNLLRSGDVLFFTPKRSHQPKEWVVTGTQYRCTGVLTVLEVRDAEFVFNDSRLDSGFRSRYRKDLRRHEIGRVGSSKRMNRIRRLLPQNFIYGDPSRSIWKGPSGPSLPPLVKRLGLGELAEKLQKGIYNQQLPTIPEEHLPRLLREF